MPTAAVQKSTALRKLRGLFSDLRDRQNFAPQAVAYYARSEESSRRIYPKSRAADNNKAIRIAVVLTFTYKLYSKLYTTAIRMSKRSEGSKLQDSNLFALSLGFEP